MVGAMVIQITGAAAGSLFWIGNGNGNTRHYCLMRLARSCNRLHHDNGSSSSSSYSSRFRSKPQSQTSHGFRFPLCLPSSSSPITPSHASPKLYVSGLSFRTTEESLRNAFQKFGELVEGGGQRLPLITSSLEVLKIANRPRGFAFLRYASEEESKSAIAGMHGKFLDGRVIFVEVARPRSELHQDIKRK